MALKDHVSVCMQLNITGVFKHCIHSDRKISLNIKNKLLKKS